MIFTSLHNSKAREAIYNSPDTELVEISTGEVKVGQGEIILNASALGSCIAVVAFDPIGRRGGMAHVMLPGKARQDGDPKPFRFVENGIEALIESLQQQGSFLQHTRICIAGAANVLRRPDDTICAGNINSVRKKLLTSGLSICSESVGGFVRRRVRLYLPAGHVECAIGDDPPFCLWNPPDDYNS
jgi:chemotaxis protein CheD